MFVNGDGNYAVITNSDDYKVDVAIYKSKEEYESGFDPFFDKVTSATWHCDKALKEAIDTTPANGASSKKIRNNLNTAIGIVIENFAVADANKFRVQGHNSAGEVVYIPGNWTIWTASVQ